MNCVILAEDITLAVQQQRDFETPGGVSPLAELMFMGQKLGLGVIVVCHSLLGLGPLIGRNIEAWIVTRFQGEEPRLVGNLLGLTPEQLERTRTLRPGEFIIFNPVLWPKPVYAVFAPPVIPNACDDALRQKTLQGFFASVTTRPPAPLEAFGRRAAPAAPPTGPAPAPAAGHPPAEQIQMLMIITSGLPKTAGQVYEALGMSRARCRKVAKALEAAGAITTHRFSTGRVGGQLGFFEVLDPGWAMLQARGLSKPAPLTNGGFEHELAAQLLKAEAQRHQYAIQFEVDVGGVRIDAVLTHKQTGQKICCQIGISKPDHEVDSIEKFFGLPISKTAKFVLIARDVAFAKDLKKHFKARKITDAIVKQVHVRLLADLIT